MIEFKSITLDLRNLDRDVLTGVAEGKIKVGSELFDQINELDSQLTYPSQGNDGTSNRFVVKIGYPFPYLRIKRRLGIS